LQIYDAVFRVLAVSVVHSAILHKWYCFDNAVINAPSLAYLLEHCQSLKALTLRNLEMDEDHGRVLGAYSRPDLDIEMIYCVITVAGASVLVEVHGRNQGPTKLDNCDIDTLLLADGKHLISQFSGNIEDRNRQLLAMVDSIRENRGLVEWLMVPL
jgi:hypothetical protein